jgi:deoxyribodipyrimidine photo-lyase
MTSLVWFRQDLRIADNRALAAALESGAAIVPVYLFAPEEEAAWSPGAASRWWLHHSLARLDEDLRKLGSRLILRQTADCAATLRALAEECGARRIVWNRRYEPAAVVRDTLIKTSLQGAGIAAASFNGSLLHEPWEIKNKAGGAFQVFTPFWRHCLAQGDPAAPPTPPRSLPAPPRWPESGELSSLGLLPRIHWTPGLEAAWTPGSAAAHGLLERFLAESLADYKMRRDRPDLAATSRLSPHLHFGEIGPREVWAAVRRQALEHGHGDWRQSHFLTELGWREFSYHLLYHFPQTPEEPLRSTFARFPWKSAPEALRAWQRGRTGYPIVDAGMRQLWHTGWMHNRVRMIVASFLVKDLMLPWQEGARWFWDTLVDADLASNTQGWQWVAGCGADAAPYFRIFNPTTQALKFDPEGAYVRRWVPELERLPGDWLQEPWAAPADILSRAGVRLGVDYPRPVVDHTLARAEALAALATLQK